MLVKRKSFITLKFDYFKVVNLIFFIRLIFNKVEFY